MSINTAVIAYTGNPTGGDWTDCDGFVHGYQGLCGYQGSEGGGAAWRIYNVNDTGPSQEEASILGGAGITTQTMQKDCKGTGWYVSFGWEGSAGTRFENVQTGPARWNEAIIDAAAYNNYGAKSYEELKAYDSLPNNLKITFGAAQELYNLEYGTKNIPSTEGYFCITDRVTNSTFEGYSKVQDTSTDWTSTSKSAEIYVANCGGACPIQFEHGIRRTKGSRNITYTVEGVTKDFAKETLTTNERSVGLGETVCESLTFQPNTSSNDTATTTACAKVPYNFILTPEMIGEDNIAYAGETITSAANITVEARDNEKTNDTYATKAPNAKYAVIGYIPTASTSQNAREVTNAEAFCSGAENCNYYEVADQTFNTNNNTKGSTDSLRNLTLNVPDVAAGSSFCVAVAVYPANSMNDAKMDTDWTGANWQISNSKCYTVAKKPSFQIWGGMVYSNGVIKVSRNNKVSSVGKVFGSWGELGVVAKGAVTNFASGAALSGGMAASKNSDVDCKLGPLTIANRDCKYGNSGIGVGDSVRASLAEYAKNHRDEDRIQYCETDCIVDTNQIYQNDNNFKIIYAERDVKINCEVTRIDAIIAAGGTVDTCANPGAETNDAKNAANRSNQLMINGSVIASRMILGRTYGAATGDNTAIPAEIINALPSFYYLSVIKNDADSGKATNFYTTYQHQLAPRQ